VLTGLGTRATGDSHLLGPPTVGAQEVWYGVTPLPTGTPSGVTSRYDLYHVTSCGTCIHHAHCVVVPAMLPPVGGTWWWWVCTMYVQGVVVPARGSQGVSGVPLQDTCIQGCTWLYPHIGVCTVPGTTPYGHPQGCVPSDPCTLI